MKLKIIEKVLCVLSGIFFLVKGFTAGIVALILIEVLTAKKAKVK